MSVLKNTLRWEKTIWTALAVVLISVAHAIALDMRPKIHRESEEVRTAKSFYDVTYGVADGVELKMSIYLPLEAQRKLVPVVVCVHGGAWKTGRKSGLGSPVLALLVQRGFAVAAIDYRLAPEFRFPAQIEDCKCAVRFLRAHSVLLNIDRNSIGAMGESAGGHLVALLGLTDTNMFEGNGGWQRESSRVQAVADLFGPTDLETSHWDFKDHSEYKWTAKNVFGATREGDPAMIRASPVNYISSNAPPFFILHGDMDNVVPVTQSIELYNKLKAAGDPATLLIVKNLSHGAPPPGLTPEPSEEQFYEAIVNFFERTLKR